MRSRAADIWQMGDGGGGVCKPVSILHKHCSGESYDTSNWSSLHWRVENFSRAGPISRPICEEHAALIQDHRGQQCKFTHSIDVWT